VNLEATVSDDGRKQRAGGSTSRPRHLESERSPTKIVLTAESVVFHSQLDEAGFFWSLKELVCPSHGVGRRLLVTVRLPAPDTVVRGLLGLFRRYAVDTGQLAVFQDLVRKPWLTRTVLRAAMGAR
jgi:hypothetical protein